MKDNVQAKQDYSTQKNYYEINQGGFESLNSENGTSAECDNFDATEQFLIRWSCILHRYPD